ncbi:MAG TPA: SigB/SigF/SigG family RNA polymerase sigma factor [Bacilli bacterium]|nr:SigB/SigF/SigG family RNA polymerase sigma factor [Bacilli bacterium]
MAKNKVEISGIKTSELIVLTSDEMEMLFRKLINGDKSVRETIASGNLKLVLSILKSFNHKNENMDDLFQVGCIGLMKAIDNFDLSHNVKFSTYAVPMILGEVKRYLRDNISIRVARSVKDMAYLVLRTKETLTNINSMEPTISEIAKILNISEVDIVNAIDSLKTPVSIFEPIYNDGGDTIYLYDQIEDKKSRHDLDIKLAIEKAMNNLSSREQYILDQRFFAGKTQMEIAAEIGISQAQISRLEKNALTRIRKQI